MHIKITAEDYDGEAKIRVMPGNTINNFMSSIQFYPGEEKIRFIIENWNKIKIEDLEHCIKNK